MSLLSLCNSTADIERATTTVTTIGGKSQSFSVQYNDIPVSIQPANGRVVEDYAKRSMQITHTIYTPTTIALKQGDRVVSGGVYYIVQGWRDMAGRARAYAIHCLRKDQ